MTGPANIPPDPRLPGLSVALNRDALLAEFRTRLPECLEGAEPVDVSSMDVQYRPGVTATVLVKLKLRQDGRMTRPLIFIQALPVDAPPPLVEETTLAAYRERAAGRGARRKGLLREPVLHWKDLGLHLFAFPVDPRLPRLGEALDPEAVRESLHRAWQPRGVRVRRVDVKLMSYTPESRAALRYEVLSEDKTTGLPELRRLVGKVQRRKPPEELFTGHWAVWRATSGRVNLAPPVGYVATAGLTFQELLEARRLSDLAGKASFGKNVRAAARAIATVNGTTLALPNLRDAAKECRTVDRWVRILSRLRPGLAGRLEQHGARLKTELESRFRARGTVHSDFHLANVMVNGRGVTLIDWDQVAHGDPALDAGRFLGALRVASLRVTGEPNGLAEDGQSFLETYLAQSGEPERQVRLFESVALMIASASPFRLQREGWQEHAELLIAESELALDRATAGPALAVAAASPRPLPLPIRREWAMERTYAASLLSPVVRAAQGEDIEITECRPRLLQANEEVLRLRWDLKGWRGGERWRSQVEGLGVAGHTGTALERRLSLVHEAAGERSEALALPRPLGHLAPISVVLIERVPSRSVARRLGSEEEAPVLERLGRALAGLAAVAVELDKERTPRREGIAIGRRIDRLEAEGHPACARLRDLLERALAAAEAGPPCTAPTPHPLPFADLVFDDERIGTRMVRDLVAAPAGAALAGLLSQLTSMSLRGDAGPEAPGRLRSAFLGAAGLSAGDIAGQEALMLIRRACRRFLSHPEDERASELLRIAGDRLEAAS
jgi:Ser/Thr protein kinase RdoA (MazF antagonist)